MRTITIHTKVTNPSVIEALKAAKEKKRLVHELISKGIHPSQIPEDLKIRLSK